MAQSNGDEELRERVTKLLWGGRTDVDGVMQLFEAYRKQHELDARIDELEKVRGTFLRDGMHRESKLWAADRIAELKAEREELK